MYSVTITDEVHDLLLDVAQANGVKMEAVANIALKEILSDPSRAKAIVEFIKEHRLGGVARMEAVLSQLPATAKT
jgi:hypothetical protein